MICHSWQDVNGNSISPIQSVSDGDYTFKLNVTDPYGSFVSSSFNLSMIEENDEPSVLISAINETDIGLNQNFIENQNINLYGFIDDSNNDINGSTSTSDDDIDLLWECIHDGNPLVINNENALNTFIESINLPDVNSNSDVEI